VLALKGNQGGLYEDVRTFLMLPRRVSLTVFSTAIIKRWMATTVAWRFRRYWTVDQIEWLADRPKWKGLKLIGMVESERHIGDTVTVERRYYISSLANDASASVMPCGAIGVSRTPCTGLWMLPLMKMACRVRRGRRGELCGATTYRPELAAAGKNGQGGSQSQAL